jgi:hypothetical protein
MQSYPMDVAGGNGLHVEVRLEFVKEDVNRLFGPVTMMAIWDVSQFV